MGAGSVRSVAACCAAPNVGFGQSGGSAACAAGQARDMFAQAETRRGTSGAGGVQFGQQVLAGFEDYLLARGVGKSPQVVFYKHLAIVALAVSPIESLRQAMCTAKTFVNSLVTGVFWPKHQVVFRKKRIVSKAQELGHAGDPALQVLCWALGQADNLQVGTDIDPQ